MGKIYVELIWVVVEIVGSQDHEGHECREMKEEDTYSDFC